MPVLGWTIQVIPPGGGFEDGGEGLYFSMPSYDRLLPTILEWKLSRFLTIVG